MSLRASLAKVDKLNEAIVCRKYDEIESLLADPQVPVNLRLLEVELPVKKMLRLEDPKVAQLFLNCPRIDWLAPTWDRNLHSLEADYGVQYEPKVPAKNVFDYFYYLEPNFVRSCPEEACLIYKKIIDSLVASSNETSFDRLLFNTVKSLMPFQIALTHSANIDVTGENSRTLLHETSDIEVIKRLVQMGADVNAMDADEMTPLMHSIESYNWEVADLLIKKQGAAVTFVNTNVFSVLSKNTPQSDLLNRLDFTEALFISEIRHGRYTFELGFLLKLFEKYPKYKLIFEANLPENLPVVKDCYLTDYSRSLTDAEYLKFLKLLLCRPLPLNFDKALKNQPELVSIHANDLLHLAARTDELMTMEDLVKNYNADPNSRVDGKTALFVAKEFALEFLLDNGVDSSIECDGCKFYERADFLTDKQPFIHVSWLLKLLKKGLNVCSIVERLKHKESIFVSLVFGLNFIFPSKRCQTCFLKSFHKATLMFLPQ